MTSIRSITVRIGGDGGTVKRFTGRVAWTLMKLVGVGEKGIAPIGYPAPRWSQYVHLLRRGGIEIETIEEQHGGPYAGRHGRYVLRTTVEVLARSEVQ